MAHLRFCRFSIDLERREARAGSEILRLSQTECKLLRYLAERPGQSVTREELLEAVWRVHRDSNTRTVDTFVRRLRAKLEDDPSQPRALLTVYGEGYRFISAQASPAPVAPQPKPVESRLPRPLTAFVGRAAELELIDQALASGQRLLTLHGPAGAGKSRLAIEAVRRNDGPAWHVDLHDVAVVELVVRRVAEVLGLEPDRGMRLSDQVGCALDARGANVLILDGCDRVAGEASFLVQQWLATATRLIVVATSQVPFAIDGETVFPVGPMARGEAIELIGIRARAAGVHLGPEATAPLERIVGRVDALPLALELAAARLTLISAPELADRLSVGLDLLASARAVGLRRHRTLTDAIRWAYDQLTPGEADLFRQCSVFVGPFSLEAAEAVLEPAADIGFVLDGLERLRDRALVSVDAQTSRFRMLQSIRDLALRELADGTRESVEARHAEYFTRAGAEASHRYWVTGDGGAASFLRLAVPELLAARDRYADPQPAIALQALAALRGAWSCPSIVGVLAVRVGAHHLAGADPATCAYALLVEAQAEHAADRLDDANRTIELALEHASRADPECRGLVLAFFGMMGMQRGAASARTSLAEAAALLAPRAAFACAHTHKWAGLVCYDKGDLEGMDRAADELLGLARVNRWPALEAEAWRAKSRAAWTRGELVTAEQAARRAVSLAIATDDEPVHALALTTLSQVLYRQRRLEEAEQTCATAVSMLERQGARSRAAAFRYVLGTFRVMLGRIDEGADLLESAALVLRAAGKSLGYALALRWLMLARLYQGRLPEALEAGRVMMDTADFSSSSEPKVSARADLGSIQHVAGLHEEAQHTWGTVIDCDEVDPKWRARCRVRRARAWRDRGRTDDADRELTSAERVLLSVTDEEGLAALAIYRGEEPKGEFPWWWDEVLIAQAVVRSNSRA